MSNPWLTPAGRAVLEKIPVTFRADLETFTVKINVGEFYAMERPDRYPHPSESMSAALAIALIRDVVAAWLVGHDCTITLGQGVLEITDDTTGERIDGCSQDEQNLDAAYIQAATEMLRRAE